MRSNTQYNRDPLRFSLRGTRLVNSHAMLPVLADDGINRAWNARFGRRLDPELSCEESALTRQIEDLLSRYFAHGCCDAA